MSGLADQAQLRLDRSPTDPRPGLGIGDRHDVIGHGADVPDTDEALKAAPDLVETLKLLLAGRTIRQAWIPAAQAQIDICKRAGP